MKFLGLSNSVSSHLVGVLVDDQGCFTSEHSWEDVEEMCSCFESLHDICVVLEPGTLACSLKTALERAFESSFRSVNLDVNMRDWDDLVFTYKYDKNSLGYGGNSETFECLEAYSSEKGYEDQDANSALCSVFMLARKGAMAEPSDASIEALVRKRDAIDAEISELRARKRTRDAK